MYSSADEQLVANSTTNQTAVALERSCDESWERRGTSGHEVVRILHTQRTHTGGIQLRLSPLILLFLFAICFSWLASTWSLRTR